MAHGPRALLAGGLGLTAAFVVACGSQNGLLASDQANNLNAEAGSVAAAVSAHNCGAASSAAAALGNAVSKLPGNVNQTLVSNLGQGAATVSELAARDCSSTTSKTTNSTSTPSTTVSTPTTTVSTPTTTTTVTNPTTHTATNPGPPSTSSTPNGGAGLPGGPSGGAGPGGAGPGR